MNDKMGIGVWTMSLLGRIDRYCRRHKLPPSKFGRLAVHDPRLVHDMRLGRELGPAIRAKIEAFMVETV